MEMERNFAEHPEWVELLGIAEDELIDEYVSESLGDSERTRFLNYYLSTTERHRKVMFSRVLMSRLKDPGAPGTDKRPEIRTATRLGKLIGRIFKFNRKDVLLQIP